MNTKRATGGVELVADSRASLGEGPIWDYRTSELVWVDILGKAVHRFDPQTGADTAFRAPAHVSVVALRRSGGLLAGLKSGIAALSPDGHLEVLNDFLKDVPELRINDGRVDSAGRFWFGTMAYDQRTAAGSLYRFDVDHSLHSVLKGVTISNGLAWSPGNRALYYIDTPTRRVDIFDYDLASGSIANRRPFVFIQQEGVFPDGLTVDADGFVWVCLWGAGTINRYSPDGLLQETIELPVTQVTSCAFGGTDLSDLYVTSARDALSDTSLEQEPLAGGLFRVATSVRGRREIEFGG